MSRINAKEARAQLISQNNVKNSGTPIKGIVRNTFLGTAFFALIDVTARFTSFFQDPLVASDTSILIVYSSLFAAATLTLRNACEVGKKQFFLAPSLLAGTTFGSILAGTNQDSIALTQTTGMLDVFRESGNLYLSVLGINWSLVDISLFGGATAATVATIYLYQKAKRTIHKHPKCNKRIPCVHICPECHRIVDQTFRPTDLMNLLKACQYLDEGTLKLNTIEAIAFMYYQGLMNPEKIIYIEDEMLWKHSDLKKAAFDNNGFQSFKICWEKFREDQRQKERKSKGLEYDIQTTLDLWRKDDSSIKKSIKEVSSAAV